MGLYLRELISGIISLLANRRAYNRVGGAGAGALTQDFTVFTFILHHPQVYYKLTT